MSVDDDIVVAAGNSREQPELVDQGLDVGIGLEQGYMDGKAPQTIEEAAHTVQSPMEPSVID